MRLFFSIFPKKKRDFDIFLLLYFHQHDSPKFKFCHIELEDPTYCLVFVIKRLSSCYIIHSFTPTIL